MKAEENDVFKHLEQPGRYLPLVELRGPVLLEVSVKAEGPVEYEVDGGADRDAQEKHHIRDHETSVCEDADRFKLLCVLVNVQHRKQADEGDEPQQDGPSRFLNFQHGIDKGRNCKYGDKAGVKN